MNPEKLKKLQAQAALVRIGGKGMNYRRFSLFSEATWFCLRFFAKFLLLHRQNSCFSEIRHFRNTSSQEEGCPPDRGHRRQEVAINAQETRLQQHCRNRRSQSFQERRICDSLQQSSNAGIAAEQRLRHQRTLRKQERKKINFPRNILIG